MRLSLCLAFFCLFPLALSPGTGTAQECPEGRISYIFVDNKSIFDLSELDPDARFRWAYRLANKLHVRTREKFILDELLFRVGDCVDNLILAETERLLRSYRFIGDADVFALPQPDGDQHINVYTRDEWTTKVDLGFRIDGGVKIEGLEVSEENFLGRGLLLKGFLKKDKEVQDMGVEIETPRVAGTRWDARLSLGTTRTGNFFEESLTYPFLGEVGRLGARQSFLWRETVFSYSTNGHPVFSHLLLPFLDQRWDVALGTRLGEPGDLFMLGAGISRESIEFRDLPGSMEYVVDKDFSNPIPVDSAGFAEIRGQTVSRRANRVNFFLGKRNISFVQRRGLDALRGIQDIAVGTEAFLGLGRTWKALQEGGGISAEDLHAQASIFLGRVWEAWTINAQATTEARHVKAKGEDAWDWKDIFAEADVYLYWQPNKDYTHTLLFRLSAAGGWLVETPFQLTLGGRAALRGYREEAFPGGRRIILTLEDRIFLPSPAPGLFDLGLAIFLDAGHMNPGDAPFGVRQHWIGTIGTGLRLGLPPGTKNVFRLDVAIPFGRKVQLKDLVVRFGLTELLGILPGLEDRQLLRSLRSGVRPGFITLPW